MGVAITNNYDIYRHDDDDDQSLLAFEPWLQPCILTCLLQLFGRSAAAPYPHSALMHMPHA